jgi:hypothetical protein
MDKIKAFWAKNNTRIGLFMGVLLVATIAFEAGLLKGKSAPNDPLIIEIPSPVAPASIAITETPGNTSTAPNAKNSSTNQAAAQASVSTPAANCQFVGSKNSTKYHLPSCQWAKRIKPENLVCFSSAEDATAKGYQPDKNCVK